MATRKAAPTKVLNHPVGPVGYGLMSLTMPWNPIPHEEAAKIMKAALDQGANLWNGGIHYGKPDNNSLHLLRYYFTNIKGCIQMTAGGPVPIGSPEGIRASVDTALAVLGGIKKIDIFEMALADLVNEGKIGGIGLSEVNANTIRKAHAVHPISQVEIELSLFTPDPLHNGIVDTCHELGIPIAAYSPVGRGWLTDKYRSQADMPTGLLATFDRSKSENFELNLKLSLAVEEMAKQKGLTASQVAIAWVASQGTIPIPGSSNLDCVKMNSKCVELTDEDFKKLQKIIETVPVAGKRYGGVHEKLLNA